MNNLPQVTLSEIAELESKPRLMTPKPRVSAQLLPEKSRFGRAWLEDVQQEGLKMQFYWRAPYFHLYGTC